MILKIDRTYKKDTYTIGNLYINDVWFSNTLEDKDRELNQTQTLEYIKSHKIYGQTAIPKGIYKVTLTYSPKFKKYLPLINDVKGFSGIRIHSGNTEQDSLGCILVGHNKTKGKVINSRETMNKLIKLMHDAIANKETIILTIQ